MSTSTRSASGLVPALTRHAAVTVAAVLWLLGMLIPFISGSVNLWVASPGRTFNMPRFIGMLIDDGQAVTAAAVSLLLVAAPLALFAMLTLRKHRFIARMGSRLALASWTLVLVDLIFLLGIRAGVDAKATPHLLPGFWLLLAALVIAALRASAALLRPRQRGAAPRTISPAGL